MNSVKRLWQKIMPNFLLSFIRFVLEPGDYTQRRKAVLNYYRNIDHSTLPPQIMEGLNYLKCHKYTPLPFRWTGKYENHNPKVYRDSSNQHLYIIYEGKKMYFPKSFTDTGVTWSVRAAMREQDPSSPHLYLTPEFQPVNGSVIIDAGVAEGNFALSVVEKAAKLYLVECDPGWMEALKLTFEPWKGKVVFIEKFMSDVTGETTTTIDDLLEGEENDHCFIKLDIEGYEMKALSGMKRLIESGKQVRMNVCTYHHHDDFREIKSFLDKSGFVCYPTEGFVLFFHEGEEPSFRKVLIRAEKIN